MQLTVVTDYSYPGGGIEHFVRHLLIALAGEFDCSVLAWDHAVLAPQTATVVAPIDRGDVREAWRTLAAADLLLTPTSFNVRLLSRLAGEVARETRVPLVSVVQTSGHSRPDEPSAPIQTRWLRELLERSARIVAASDDVAVALRNVVTGRLVDVFSNAARLPPAAMPRARGRKTVSFIGRPFEQKGFPHFIRLTQDLAGSGLSFEANTVSMPVDPLSAPDIRLSHLVSDDELIDFFDRADVLVAPYMRGDGLPLAILEALTRGTPIIGYDAPGLGALLREHSQHVIAPEYGRLLEALQQWRRGQLHIPLPPSHPISSWDQIGARYANLLREVRADAAA